MAKPKLTDAPGSIRRPLFGGSVQPPPPNAAAGLRRGGRAGRPPLSEAEKAFSEVELEKLRTWLEERARDEVRRRRSPGPRQRDWLVVETMLGAGLRVSEVAGLVAGDVRHGGPDPYLVVRGGKMRPAYHSASVPLGTQLAAYLERWISGWLEKDDWLFTCTNGEPLDRRNVWAIVKKAVRGAGLRAELNAHSLRHAYVTRLANQPGADIYTVARLARVRRVETLMVYFHARKDQVRAMVDSVGQREAKAPD